MPCVEFLRSAQPAHARITVIPDNIAVLQKMADKPHQFQMAYVAEQDRMLLQISTRDKAEFRLWLTRRAVRLLWDGLLKTVEAGLEKDTTVEADKRETILLYEHQAAMEQADFETPFQGEADSFPLGEEGALVASMWVGGKSNGAYSLKLGSRQGKGIAINLDDRLMHSFMQMLIDASNRAGWGLELSLPTQGSTTLADLSLPDRVLRH